MGRRPSQLALSAIALVALASSCRAQPLRLWIDQYAFGGLAETQLLREAAAATGGWAVLAGEARSAAIQLKGYQQLRRWDVYWTSRAGCYAAFHRPLNASHAVGCTPGSQALTDKAALVRTLVAALGMEAAFSIVPPSYVLPESYTQLARLIKRGTAGAGAAPAAAARQAARGSALGAGSGTRAGGRDGSVASPLQGMWVLKEEAHRGAGLAMASGATLLGAALARGAPAERRFVLAQAFLADQHLVGGRPYYVRLWALLLGAARPRAFLFDGGVVVFGQRQLRAAEARTGVGDAAGPGSGMAAGPAAVQGGSSGSLHQRRGTAEQPEGQQQTPEQAAEAMVVNLWRQDRAAAKPWSLRRLLRHVALHGGGEGVDAAGGGGAAAAALWAGMQRALAVALAAGAPALRAVAARLPGFQEGSFEVLGVDFLVDSSLKPWMVEINHMPSLARKVLDGRNHSSGGGGDGAGSSGGGSRSRREDSAGSSGGGGGAGGGRGGTDNAAGGECNGGDSGAASRSCAPGEAFDKEKARFVRALLQLLLARRDALAAAPAVAAAAAARWHASRPEGEQGRRLCLGDTELAQLLAMQQEAAAAEGAGFVSLTQQLWEAASGGGCVSAAYGASVSSSFWDLPWLGARRRPAPQQACIPPSPERDRVLRWLRGGGDVSALCAD